MDSLPFFTSLSEPHSHDSPFLLLRPIWRRSRTGGGLQGEVVVMGMVRPPHEFGHDLERRDHAFMEEPVSDVLGEQHRGLGFRALGTERS